MRFWVPLSCTRALCANRQTNWRPFWDWPHLDEGKYVPFFLTSHLYRCLSVFYSNRYWYWVHVHFVCAHWLTSISVRVAFSILTTLFEKYSAMATAYSGYRQSDLENRCGLGQEEAALRACEWHTGCPGRASDVLDSALPSFHHLFEVICCHWLHLFRTPQFACQKKFQIMSLSKISEI